MSDSMYRSYCLDCDFSIKWGSKDDAEAAANNHSTVNPHTTRTELADDDDLSEGMEQAELTEDSMQYDEDEVGRIRIEENDDPRRDFDIGSSLIHDEILYLRLPTEDIRGLRDWCDAHLEEVDSIENGDDDE